MFLTRLISMRFLALILALVAGTPLLAQDTSPHSDAQLIAEVSSAQPGEPFWAGIRLKMEPNWHSYWINPGDSGQATSIKFDDPQKYTNGEIEWPYPELISLPPLASYGYSHEVLLPIRITPAAALKPGESLTVSGKAEWLICADVCLPAEQQVSFTLPVRAQTPQPDPRHQPLFAATRERLPRPAPGEARARLEGDNFILELQQVDKAAIEKAQFFALDTATINHAAPQQIAWRNGTATVTLAKSEYLAKPPASLNGVLVAAPGKTFAGGIRASLIGAPLPHVPPGTASGTGAAVSPVADASTGAGPRLLTIAAFAFLGGLILNLMPCVFPVLSLKVLSFAQQGGAERAHIRAHGIAFAAGVVLSFVAIGGLLLALRGGGAELGWGFQLQSPLFVAAMALLFFVIGLNLLGAFEVGLSLTRLAAAGSGHGLRNSFLTGILATLCATPCTAPFMGTALGFAVAQPAAIALLTFTALGLGMAAPYVVLSFAPALVAKLPRPGRWMETFKQALAFPMFATAVWLVWVFALQTGPGGVAALLGSVVLLALAVWTATRWKGATAKTLAVVFLLAAAAAAYRGSQEQPPAITAADSSKNAWQDYSPEAVAAARTAGRPVFIDFTAAWCLTCQVNERTVLLTAEIQQEFAARNVALFKADWTRRDPVITRALEAYGRSGVPVYVLYPGPTRQPFLLPEVLTAARVREALAVIPVSSARAD